MSACGLDFGTSNSGVSQPTGASVRLLPLEDGLTSIPSAVFIAAEASHAVSFGRAGIREYLDGTPGRLMRSLKSLLGNSLIHEATSVGGRSIRFVDVVTLFLATLRQRASEASEASLDSVVLGRPVRFVDDDLDADRDAEATLRACARAAGFRNVEFQLEPIAAAFDYERTLVGEEVVLVVDVGGGTADFTVIRLGARRRKRIERRDDVLASDGVHVAGTDFDSRLHLSWVMPILGHGSVGAKGRIVPSGIYFELSAWHRINLLHGPKYATRLRELRAFFADPLPFQRLSRVIEQQLGHELLGRTEEAKIALSEVETAVVDLAPIDDALRVPVSSRELLSLLDDLLARLVRLGVDTVASAGLAPDAVSTLYFTGGSSGMTSLRQAFVPAFPTSRVVVGDLFGSVVSGLGIDAGRRFGERRVSLRSRP